jgi:hypothetical protein
MTCPFDIDSWPAAYLKSEMTHGRHLLCREFRICGAGDKFPFVAPLDRTLVSQRELRAFVRYSIFSQVASEVSMRRIWLLHTSVTALAIGVLFLAAPFIEIRGRADSHVNHSIGDYDLTGWPSPPRSYFVSKAGRRGRRLEEEGAEYTERRQRQDGHFLAGGWRATDARGSRRDQPIALRRIQEEESQTSDSGPEQGRTTTRATTARQSHLNPLDRRETGSPRLG